MPTSTRSVPSFTPAPFPTLAGLGLLVLAACDSGQIGGQVSEGGPTRAGCDVSATTAIEGDGPTSIGISAEEAVASIDGTFESSLLWVDGLSQATGVSVVPAGGDSSIQVTIEPDPTSVRLVSLVVPASSQEVGPSIGWVETCDDLIAIDARVAVQTENGAFDDSFDVTFSVEKSGLAHASIPLVPGQLEGSFDVEPPEDRPQASITQVALDLNLTFGTLSGEISGGLEETDGQVTSFGGLQFGKFPQGGACLEGTPLSEETDLAKAAEGALLALDAFELSWNDGDSTSLVVQTTTGAACLVGGAQTRVVLAATSTVLSEDGLIDGQWELEGHVLMDASGKPVTAELLRQAYLAETFAPGSFAEESGITKYSVSQDLRGTFSFRIEDDLTDDLPGTGEITVMQVTPADCGAALDAEESDTAGSDAGTSSPEESGGSAPGCAGDQAEEIGGATLRAQD